jgi:hypothetical protein
MKMGERLIFFRSHKAKIAALEPSSKARTRNRVFKEYAEKRTAAEKRDYVRHAGGHRRGL